MDLTYLHMLQNLRQSLPYAFEQFFVYLSYFGEGAGLAALLMIIYWCIDKRMGQFALIATLFGSFANQLVKNIACVYRPWIRDPTLIPAKDALSGASGYSFPSGHTTGTAAGLGSLIWLELKRAPDDASSQPSGVGARRLRRWLIVPCAAVIVLMMFARNFLSVHTPQDVLVGLAIGLAAIALTEVLFKRLDTFDALLLASEQQLVGQPFICNLDLIVAGIVLLANVAALLYVSHKTYPLDFIDGVLLVDPNEMLKDCYKAIGALSGVMCAWPLERRYVRMSTAELTLYKRIRRAIVGVAVTGTSLLIARYLGTAVLPSEVATFTEMFCVAFAGVFLAPLAFRLMESAA